MVLGIAGVLAAPAIGPALEAVRGEAGARRAASFLDGVRRRSVTGRAVLTVRCDAEGDRLEVEGGAAPAAGYRLDGQVDLLECRPVTFRYFPQGYASGAVLLLRDRREREYRLSVGAFTGLARLEPAP